MLIYQLFYNLINHSLKFSKPDVAPLIKLRSSVFTREGKDYAKLVLIDNGIGFEQGYAPKIFDTFTRLNSKDKLEGTGLGLSLCKRIAGRGTRAASKPRGSPVKAPSFAIILPLKQQRASI